MTLNLDLNDATWIYDTQIKVGDLIGIYDDLNIVVEIKNVHGGERVAILDDGNPYVLYEHTKSRIYSAPVMQKDETC